MSPIAPPERNLPAPVLTWTIPSERASANPRSAPFSVYEDVMLTAGRAWDPAAAASSIAAYC
jgi:hypothetical protein